MPISLRVFKTLDLMIAIKIVRQIRINGSGVFIKKIKTQPFNCVDLNVSMNQTRCANN